MYYHLNQLFKLIRKSSFKVIQVDKTLKRSAKIVFTVEFFYLSPLSGIIGKNFSSNEPYSFDFIIFKRDLKNKNRSDIFLNRNLARFFNTIQYTGVHPEHFVKIVSIDYYIETK